jgi:hypothetical protein
LGGTSLALLNGHWGNLADALEYNRTADLTTGMSDNYTVQYRSQVMIKRTLPSETQNQKQSEFPSRGL